MPLARLPNGPMNWPGMLTKQMLSAAATSQAPSPRQFQPWVNQYRPPRWRRLNTCSASESYQPRRTNQPIIITTIHGAVQVTMSTANVEMLCTTLKANRPTKMNAIAMTPMNTVPARG